MSVRIVLSSVEGSAEFTQRELVLPPGGQARVARAGGDDHPAEDNAVFDSRVLSRAQAVFSLVNDQVYLKDIGSRNGTFVNSFRLSKAFQESEDTPVYSQDLVRFGTQSKTVQEKCIVAAMSIFSPSGEDFGTRHPDNKLHKLCAEDQMQNTTGTTNDEQQDELSDDENLTQNQSLQRNQNDTKTLKESLNKLKAREDKMLLEIDNLKTKIDNKEEESKVVAEGIAINSVIQRDKITEFENMLEEREKILQRTLNENAQLRTELGEKYSNLEVELRRCTEEINFQKEKVDHLNKCLIQSDASVEDKEKEILRLIELLNKDQTQIKEKEGAYQELESLITEEDETLQQAEKEMRRLLDIIAEDQENLLAKDKLILSLQNSLQEKESLIAKESSGISKQEMEILFKKTMDEQVIENESIMDEMRSHAEETEYKLNKLQLEFDQQKDAINHKDLEIKELKDMIETQQEHVKTHEALKMKCQELMKIIIKQNSEIETRKNDFATHDVVVSRNEILQKEVLVLKVAIQQKDMDIKSLNDLLSQKEEIISENALANSPEKNKIGNKQDSVEDKEQTIQNLQQKIMNEQDINDQSEEEIIQLRIEIENLKREIENNSGSNEISTDQQTTLLKTKDDEIDKLKKDILKDQQIIDDIKVTQRNEMMEEEKEIYALNKALKEERDKWARNEKDLNKFEGNSTQDESMND